MAEKLGLVLSGGGSKGAYEMGVYKALKKLGKTPDIVTGTSVGAINGMFIVQKDFKKAIKMWKNISFSAIYDENSFEDCDNPNIATIYGKFAKLFITEGGMDVHRLKHLLDLYYRPKKFFSSNIDFGLVTYNLSKNKPVLITKKQMNEDNVKDYVMASASCYPAFKPYKIDDDLYVDGGYYDNMPINLAVDMGASNIIAVDLRSVGFNRNLKTNVPVLVISPRNKIASFLIFNKVKSREAVRFGYNDTMKTFHKYDGDKFTFKKGDLVKNYNKNIDLFEENLKHFKLDAFENFLNKKSFYKNFNTLVEKSGICFEIPMDLVYNIKGYNRCLIKALLETPRLSSDFIFEKIKSKNIKGVLERKQIVKFFYDEIGHRRYDNLFKFFSLFSDEFLIAIYIYSISGNKIKW